MSIPEALRAAARSARDELMEHVKPCDDFERAVVNALGDISWNEAVEAINKHRSADNGEVPRG